MEIAQLLKSKGVMIGLGIGLAAVAFVTFELYMQKRQVDSEVARLAEQAERLNTDNRHLDELINYMGTTEFTEREAREKLNLKKPGEQVVFLPADSDEAAGTGEPGAEPSIPAKWFDYFFSHR